MLSKCSVISIVSSSNVSLNSVRRGKGGESPLTIRVQSLLKRKRLRSRPTLSQIRKLPKAKGLPHKKFHALRHTSATLSLIYGNDIKTVGERLGHSQMKTTNRYLHAIEEADRRAADVLGGIVLTLQAENRKKHQEAS